MTTKYPYFTRDFIEKYLHILSSEDGRIISLYLLEKKSQKEIAEELSFPISKTKNKITKAILKLRKVSNDREYLKAMKILGKE